MARRTDHASSDCLNSKTRLKFLGTPKANTRTDGLGSRVRGAAEEQVHGQDRVQVQLPVRRMMFAVFRSRRIEIAWCGSVQSLSLKEAALWINEHGLGRPLDEIADHVAECTAEAQGDTDLDPVGGPRASVGEAAQIDKGLGESDPEPM